MTSADLIEVLPREQGVYRLAWRPGDVFAPPPWRFANPVDGTFGNRFDDPGIGDGHGSEERFRMIYCGTNRICALMESIAHFRQSVSFLAMIKDEAEVFDEHVDVIGFELHDPDYPSRGIIPSSWRLEHQIGHTRLDPSLRFVDLGATRTLNHLRIALADVVLELGFSDIDLSAVTGPDRKLTQRIARYIYDQVGDDGQPRFAGIRYLSHYGDNQECWAIFEDRMITSDTHVDLSILPDDEDLLAVAKLFGLSIEILDGHYLQP